MILDSLDNFDKYLALNINFNIVSNFLRTTDLINLPEGKIEISDSVFAIISNYTTKQKEESFIEYHKKYIDIQIVISGCELIGYTAYKDCIDINFFDDKDYGKLEGELNFFKLKSGYFALFFPFEGHMPQIIASEFDKYVKKIVFKIETR